MFGLVLEITRVHAMDVQIRDTLDDRSLRARVTSTEPRERVSIEPAAERCQPTDRDIAYLHTVSRDPLGTTARDNGHRDGSIHTKRGSVDRTGLGENIENKGKTACLSGLAARTTGRAYKTGESSL